MTYVKPAKYVIACAMMVTLLQGCANALPGASFCDIYVPIYMSEQDSSITKAQIDQNNAAWLALCLN